MRRYFPIPLLLLMFLFFSCGLQSILSREPKVQPGDDLFFKAESLFEAQSYDEALEIYKAYVSQYPQGHLAPRALLNMGDIHMLQGNGVESRRVYQRLIETYPKSSLVQDAQIASIATYYYEGNYDEVFQRSADVLKDLDSSRNFVRMYTLLGDTHKALFSPVDAIKAYIKAFQHAGPQEKDESRYKLKTEIAQLASPDIISLLGQIEESIPRGYLLYQLGSNYIQEEKIGKAEKTLNEFVEQFPEHEMVAAAKSLLLDLKKESAYDHETIGCLLPLSGRYKAFGNRALRGIELALTQFHSSDNPGLSQLKLIIKDTGSTPEKAIQGIRELAEERVAAIIGPLISSEEAIYQAQKQRIPIIALVQQQDIPELGDYVFRNFLTPRMQAEAIVSYAVQTLGLKKFAILYPEENYGKTFMNAFWDEVIHQNAMIVGVESYSPSLMDFADPIKKLIGLYYTVPEDLKENEYRFVHVDPSLVPFSPIYPPSVRELLGIKETEPETQDLLKKIFEDEQEDAAEKPAPMIDFEAIFIPDAPSKAGLILPQLSFFDIENIYLFGTNLWHSDRLIQMAREYVQGAILSEGFFAQSTSKPVRDFVHAFSIIYNEPPEFIEAVAYDSAMMLFQTVHRSDIMYRQMLREALTNILDYPGVTGLSSVDQNGDVHKKLFLLRIVGDQFMEVNDYP